MADEFELEETQEDVYQAFYLACRRLPLADRGGQSCKKRSPADCPVSRIRGSCVEDWGTM
jgi:hypothetical protein